MESSPLNTGATDTERSGYIGHANDRGSQANDRGNANRSNESNANRNESGSFSGRNQF